MSPPGQNKLILISVVSLSLLLVIFFSSSSSSSSSSPPASETTSSSNNHDNDDDGFAPSIPSKRKTYSTPSTKQQIVSTPTPTTPIKDSDYYPNGRPDRTISLLTVEDRKRMKLCEEGGTSSVMPHTINLPWIAEDMVIGVPASLEDVLSKDSVNLYWGYQNNNNNKEQQQEDTTNFLLSFGHLRRLLARARLNAVLHLTKKPSSSSSSSQLKQLSKLLSIYAPAWRITSSSSPSSSSTENDEKILIHLERRAKVFVFGITGGNLASSKRARYAEWTWGARTPIQWFADQWDENFRPIYKDQHPLYIKDRFKYLTFKISRVWQIVFKYYWKISHERVDWFIRLWDDNYFYEENLYSILYRLPFNPQKDEVLAGKLGWRHLGPADAVFPFAGGGAGWYLTSSGMKKFGETIDDMEAWIPKLRARKDIFLPHDMHDEDVFLTAWIGTFLKINCTNIPGVEHVSPGMNAKQRCLSDEVLSQLRWKEDKTIFFDYTGAKSRELRVEDTWYSYTKPLIWHYMSPKRLLKLEGLLYEERKKANGGDLPEKPDEAFSTAVDLPPRKKKACYPGVPTGEPPKRGLSLFENELPKEMKDLY